ncbi:MAG TPA: hypothetical protein VGH86_09465 [Phenylobacterium sp.]
MNQPLPDWLAKLPRMAFSRQPAPNVAAQKRADIAYDVKSSEALGREFDRREATIPKP